MLLNSKLFAVCAIVCVATSFSAVGAVPEPLVKRRSNAGVTEGVAIGASANLGGLGDVNHGNSAAAIAATLNSSVDATTASSPSQTEAQKATNSGLRSLRV
ncbi:hypothetical protein FI667_g2787, partial [Globisporangium splendens]